MKPYLDLLTKVLNQGEIRTDRTGTGTLEIFGAHLSFDLRAGFPAVTTKKLNLRSVFKELLWFLRGETNTKTLGCKIWDAWADSNGELGPIYGAQWRRWTDQDGRTIDQIQGLLDALSGPGRDSRRLILNAWNVSDLDKMALVPCHVLSQYHVNNAGELSCQVYQRSADLFLGLPFNFASYAALTHMLAKEAGLKVGDLHFCLGSAHIYRNHINQVKIQLQRDPLPLGKLVIDDGGGFRVDGYQSWPELKGEISK